MNVIESFKAFTKTKYAWPGGYPLFAITFDGACLCHTCCVDNYKYIRESQNTLSDDGWLVTSVDVNYEDEYLTCEHCGGKIESAYGED